jgi:hypothetical protein
VLSTVVIAVGLVFVSRALSGQMKALQVVGEYDALLALAQGKLLELEAQRLSGSPLPVAREGSFPEPYQGYEWRFAAADREADPLDEDGKPLSSEVTLTVQRADRGASAIRLSAMWPIDWVPDAWD